MYMNVVIAREVMILLQRTKRCQKYSPPTYKKATLQFVGVTIYSIILGLLWYYLLHYFTHRNDDDENDQNGSDSSRETYAIPLRKYSIPAFYVLVVGIPLLYLLYICVVIWYQKLLPKAQAGGGTVTTGGTGLTMVSNNRSSTNRNSTTNRLSSLLELRKGISNRNNATTTATATATALATTSATTSKSNNTIDKSTTKTKNDNDNDNNSHHQDNDISKSTATATATAIGDNNAATATTATTTTTARSSTSTSTSSPAVVRYGRLNILVMYFARIIFVFFCIWLPGMIMYYMAYVPDRNSSGLLHTVGLLFFSLQAIVSSGLAMSKPDIRQAIIDLYHDTIRTYILSVSASLKNRRRQQQQQQQGPSPSSSQSPSKLNAVIDNDIDIIDNGNIDIDKDKVNDHDHVVVDDDDGDDNGTRKETALLPITMIDGTSSSDDVEAPLMQEQSTIINTIK